MRSFYVAVLLAVGLTVAQESIAEAYNSAVDALSVQARTHLDEGDLQRAELIAQRIIRIDPDDNRGWALMADIRKAQGNDYAASEYLARARVAGAASTAATLEQQRPGLDDADRRPPAVALPRPDLDPVIQDARENEPVVLTEPEPDSDTGNSNAAIPDVAIVAAEPAADARSNRSTGNHEYRSEDSYYQSRNIIEAETGRTASERHAVPDDAEELNRVFADTGAYRPGRQRTIEPSKAQVPVHRTYNTEQRSRLDRIRQHHRRQVARLQKKLFGRDRTNHRDYRPKAEVVDRTYRSDLAFSGSSNRHNRSTASLVPPGYYPPAGYCRIWYYDLDPTQQPPVGDCDRLREQLPMGARLLFGADS